MTLDQLKGHGERLLAILIDWATSPQFYAQVVAIIAAVVVAHVAARKIRTRVALFDSKPGSGPLLRIDAPAINKAPRSLCEASRSLCQRKNGGR